MKKNTKTTKKSAKVCDCSKCLSIDEAANKQTAQDFKNTLLTVSLAVNMFFLVGWLTLQVTSYYNAEAIALIIR